MFHQSSKSLKGKTFASPEARRWAFRNRILELGSYKAVAQEVGLSIPAVGRIAGKGLTTLHRLRSQEYDA